MGFGLREELGEGGLHVGREYECFSYYALLFIHSLRLLIYAYSVAHFYIGAAWATWVGSAPAVDVPETSLEALRVAHFALEREAQRRPGSVALLRGCYQCGVRATGGVLRPLAVLGCK